MDEGIFAVSQGGAAAILLPRAIAMRAAMEGTQLVPESLGPLLFELDRMDDGVFVGLLEPEPAQRSDGGAVALRGSTIPPCGF